MGQFSLDSETMCVYIYLYVYIYMRTHMHLLHVDARGL